MNLRYVLSTMYYVLNSKHYVLCTKHYVLCSMFYGSAPLYYTVVGTFTNLKLIKIYNCSGLSSKIKYKPAVSNLYSKSSEEKATILPS